MSYRCPYCGRLFHSKKALKNHIRRAHRKKEVPNTAYGAFNVRAIEKEIKGKDKD